MKIAEELTQGLQYELGLGKEEIPRQIIDGQNYHVFAMSDSKRDEGFYYYKSDNEYNLLDEIIYQAESDDKRDYMIEITVKSRGFNTGSGTYSVLIESENSPDKHIPYLLERDHDISSTSRIRVLNEYFAGWLDNKRKQSNDENILWLEELNDDGEKVYYLDMEVKKIKDYFKKWKAAEMSEKKRFIQYGKI